MKALIGKTGFVGSHLTKNIDFNFLYNSKNIFEINKMPNEADLFLACLPAEKWIVNKNPDKDLQNIIFLMSHLQSKTYNKIFLFSTIDVYLDSPVHSNEDSIPSIKSFGYSSNRYLFEIMVRQQLKYNVMKVIRLPALFGCGLKKNIIFDLLNNNQIEKINFNSSFQWYDMNDLYEDLKSIESSDEQIHNFFTEPIETIDICKSFFDIKNPNVNFDRKEYDFRTKFSQNGYMKTKEEIFEKMKRFIYASINKQFVLG